MKNQKKSTPTGGAGTESAPVWEPLKTERRTVDPRILITENIKTEIQLSHNSINGQDDPSILAKLYEGLDLDSKKFSGLTDDILKKKNTKALYAARVEDFDQVFDQIVTIKHKLSIVNSALALIAATDLALQKIEEMEAEQGEKQALAGDERDVHAREAA